MNEGMNGGTQIQPGSVAGTSVPQPPSLEGQPVHPLEFSFRQLDTDRQQIQGQMKKLQEQQKELVDGQKVMLAFFEKFPEVRQAEITRDPIPIIIRGNRDILSGIQIPKSSQSAFLRLGKQVLLENQTEGVYPEGIVAKASRPAASRDALSSTSVTRTSRERYPRTSPECRRQILLEKWLERNREFSPDQYARRQARLPAPMRHREGVENRPTDPHRVEVPALARRIPTMDLAEETLLDIMEKRLQLRRRGQDEVPQPLGGEPLTARIRTSRLPVEWVTPSFSRFDGKADLDQHLMESQPKWIDALFDLKMGPKETLKDFVTIFREKASEVTGADRNEGIICAAFKNALLEGYPMKVDLILKPKVHFSDLYERAQKRIRVEVDAFRGKRTATVYAVAEVPGKPSAREERAIPQEFRRANPPPFNRSRGKAIAFPLPRFPQNPTREYTRFILSPEQMLEKIRGEFQYRPAIPYYISPDRIDHSKFCRYHNYNGNWTNNCFQLLDLLEEMVAVGCLKQFIKSRILASHPNRLKDITGEAVMGEDVLVIHGYSTIDEIAQNRLK